MSELLLVRKMSMLIGRKEIIRVTLERYSREDMLSIVV